MHSQKLAKLHRCVRWSLKKVTKTGCSTKASITTTAVCYHTCGLPPLSVCLVVCHRGPVSQIFHRTAACAGCPDFRPSRSSFIVSLFVPFHFCFAQLPPKLLFEAPTVCHQSCCRLANRHSITRPLSMNLETRAASGFFEAQCEQIFTFLEVGPPSGRSACSNRSTCRSI